MTTPTQPTIREEIEKIAEDLFDAGRRYGEDIGYGKDDALYEMRKSAISEAVSLFSSHLQKEREEMEKDYKDICKACRGKGYSTVRYGYSAAADFEQDEAVVEPIKTHIHYCECERGKQLQELVKKGLFTTL